MEAGAEHGIDHDVSGCEHLLKLVARRGDEHGNAGVLGTIGHYAGEVTTYRVWLDRGNHAYADAPGLEALGTNPTVSPVVAKATHHDDFLDVAHAHDLSGRRYSSPVHELRYAHAHAGEVTLHLLDILDV